ncbi:aspartate/glutamate racemase family protein [Arenicellales bacterium nBUS_48]
MIDTSYSCNHLPGGQNLYGVSIGVLCLDTFFPKPPGHIKNASSLPFTILYETVAGATIQKLLNNPEPAFILPFIEAAKRLEQAGVKAITGSCGFLALFQRELAEAVSIPVFASSLIQVPLAFQLGGGHVPVGIITASESSLTHRHFEAIGAGDIPVVIQGMEDQPEFSSVILRAERNDMDLSIVESEVVDVAQQLQTRHPEIRSIVLECTDLPPYAWRIQQVLKLPVFDLTTLTKMVHDCVRRQPYQGYLD